MAADAGKLHLSLTWDGKAVREVGINSTRPQAYRLLNGLLPEKAVQMAQLLFNVCGRAQGAAAAAAMAAAQGSDVKDIAALERGIACEAMQEHLWRLLLDWPRLLGLPQQQTDFVRWHGMLRCIGAGQGDMAVLRAELESCWLGCSAASWSAYGLDGLRAWWESGDSPAASMLAALDASCSAEAQCAGFTLLPDWSAVQALSACGDLLDDTFASRPVFRGVAAETGALGRYAATPLLRDMMQTNPSRLRARVVARILDVLDIAGARYDGRLDCVTAPDGAGLAVAQTARGILMHRVRLGAGRVEDYLIVAPTEWNFHPCGVLAAGLHGILADSRAQLAQLARTHVLSLDPCVEYGMEINGNAA
jgi:hypothetical protein